MSQVTDRHPPRLTNRGRSTRQRHVLEMSGAFEAFIAGDQPLSAPNLSVGTVASSIQGKSDYSAFEVVLRHTTCNVGVVMLDADELRSGLFERPARGEVIGVEVVGDDLRTDLEDPLEVFDGLVEKIITFDIFQISNVLT